jgi:DNA polymerase I-like protein with 3'-5' exonuclease and polymerase domains
MPAKLPDLRRAGIIALDTETNDEGLRADRGSGWPWRGGHVCGVSIAYRADGDIRSHYFPLRHPDTNNFNPEQVFRWLKDLVASDVRFVTQNGLYDWGWLRAEANIRMPSADRLEEIGALATMINENLHRYNLNDLCIWRGLPGKDETLLREAVKAAGFASGRKKINIKEHIWQLPAHLVGPYTEADAVSTLALFEDLNPIIDREGTRDAYRLEVDLLPMVHEMRRRGIRIDQNAAEAARDHCLRKRDTALADLSEKLGTVTGMDEIASPKWKAGTFDAHRIKYPRTKKGNPSFKAGKMGWMATHPHWLPQLIASANKYDAAGDKFLEGHILAHLIKGRIHAEINPHRSDNGGTRSFRFSYSDPPLQQMPSRDEELAPLIRSVFLPEDGEIWCKPDISQQEFRFVVHHAFKRNLAGAKAAVERYRNNPDTDFHELVAEITGLPRTAAKAVNFAKIYGAGVEKFGEMIGKPLSEAQRIYKQYDRQLPFVSRLARICQDDAHKLGYTLLYDGARRHWDRWAPRTFSKGAGPCSLEEAKQRTLDPAHPWFDEWLHRTDIHTALNALIQGSAARHTKLWMRACWHEGIVPLLQMHDALDCSVTTREQGELVARLACEVVQLEVQMRVDMKFGKSWGDATHTWEERHATGAASAQPQVGLSGDAAIPGEANECDVERPTGSDSEHNLDHDENIDDDDEEPPPQPAHHWKEALERDFPRASCGAAAADESEAIPPQNPPPPPQGEEPPPDDPPPRGNGGARGADDYPHGERNEGRCIATYLYRDYLGGNHTEVKKHTSKGKRPQYPQRFWTGKQWVSEKPARWLKVPYRLPQMLAAITKDPNTDVFSPEGEKDCETLVAQGLVATTNSEGATPLKAKVGKWTPELNRWFHGVRRLFIPADNDEVGRRFAEEKARALESIVPDIRIIHFPDVPEGQDVTWWLDHGHTKEELLARCEAAPRWQGGEVLESVRASDVTMRAIAWLWGKRFAIGKIGIIAGLPDEGKGQILCYIAARVTRGSLEWPNSEGRAPQQGNVIILSAEEDPGDSLTPRLAAAGADLSRVHFLKMIIGRDEKTGQQHKRMFSFVSDLEKLRQKIIEIGDVVAVLIDPISAYLGVGKIDSYRDTDVRAVLGPLKELAEEMHIAIITVMHFNKKVDITNALLRVSNSLAFVGLPRHVYGVVADAENKRKLFVRAKNNDAAESDNQTLAYHFDVDTVGADPKTGEPIRAPFIVWEPGYVDVTATGRRRRNLNHPARAKRFLEALLGEGPVNAKEVQEVAKANGISQRTLRRAKDELGIDIRKDGPVVDGERTWHWHLTTETRALKGLS